MRSAVATTRLVAFAGLSALVAWRYVGTETRPPTLRVVALAAVAVATASALLLLRVRDEAPRGARVGAAGARVLVLALLFVVALLTAGVPAHLLRPGRWGRLGHDVHGGFGTLATTVWPYAGNGPWARLDILLALAVVPLAAAALGFWPAGRAGRAAALRNSARQVGALVLLLALYVIGVLDSGGGSATLEGLVLLALIVAWLWLPGLRVRRVAAAGAWLAVTGPLAAVLAAQVWGGQAWLNYRAWDLVTPHNQRIAFAWDQSYGPVAWPRSEQTMFTVRASRAQLWKTTTLDRFDGVRFVRTGVDADSVDDYLAMPRPLNPRWYSFARFTIEGLGSALLPTEQGTTAGVNYAGALDHDRDGTVGVIGTPPKVGATYTVLSYVTAPTPAELRSAPRPFPGAYLSYTDFDLPAANQSGLRLPASDSEPPGVFWTSRTVGAPVPGSSPAGVPAMQRRILASPYGRMYRLARRLASGAHTPYDVVVAIENYLKDNYVYDEHPPVHRYPLESFLFNDQRGYCQQFSGAMTLMLRMNGIPARVAAGFLPGVYHAATRSYDVQAVDAHSWVEVYFAGIGWVPFDPTPPRSIGTVPTFAGYTNERTGFPYVALAATAGRYPQLAGARRTVTHRRGSRRSRGLSPALLAAQLAAMLVFLAAAAHWLAGSLRLRRSLRGDAELASRELVRALGRLGYATSPTVTLAELESLVRLHGGPDAARYVRLLRERRYAPRTVASATLRDRRQLRRDLTVRLGLDARLRGVWALPPGTAGWRLGASALQRPISPEGRKPAPREREREHADRGRSPAAAGHQSRSPANRGS
jgi:transglutaminase-like putative cysteine protease